jgi:autoinducer 2-degrading protein
MITRFVKLTFDPAKVEEFLKLFHSTKEAIQSSKGCIEVKLMHDIANSNIFFTVSRWESEDDLNTYRSSALFDGVWTQTKQYFGDKPQAWSVTEI